MPQTVTPRTNVYATAMITLPDHHHDSPRKAKLSRYTYHRLTPNPPLVAHALRLYAPRFDQIAMGGRGAAIAALRRAAAMTQVIGRVPRFLRLKAPNTNQGQVHQPFKQRCSIPSMKELAHVAGVTPGTLSRITRGHTRSLNLDIVQSIFSEMWRRGFKVEPNDLLTFDPPKDISATPNF